MKKFYSTLEIKSVDAESRRFTGIASTPSPDRSGDIVEPKGASYTLPIPLLWQHKHDEPIGQVVGATVTDSGIDVEFEIAEVSEPGRLKDRVDEAWQSIKSGLVRGLSIGFKPTEFAYMSDDSWAMRFIKWEWLELSAVTIPANAEATIANVKSYAADPRPVAQKLPVESAAPAEDQAPADQKPFTKNLPPVADQNTGKPKPVRLAQTKAPRPGVKL